MTAISKTPQKQIDREFREFPGFGQFAFAVFMPPKTHVHNAPFRSGQTLRDREVGLKAYSDTDIENVKQ